MLVPSRKQDQGLEHESDCRAPGYVWPLGVQFRREPAAGLPENRTKQRLPKCFEDDTPSESRCLATLAVHGC